MKIMLDTDHYEDISVQLKEEEYYDTQNTLLEYSFARQAFIQTLQ